MIKLFKNLFANVRKMIVPGTVCMLLLIVVSCGNSEEPSASDEVEDCDNTEQYDNPKLKGTAWKLVGIVDSKTGVLIELEPKHCVECYTLTFETDRIFHVRGVDRTFKMDLDNLNLEVTADLQYGIYDGNLYRDNDDFRRAVASAKSYSVTREELRLLGPYYLGEITFYSLFKRIDL
jgi:hypothetical protein